MPTTKPLDLTRLTTYRLTDRANLVDLSRCAGIPIPDDGVAAFLDSFPDFLGARDLRTVSREIVAARARDAHVAWGIGAHVLKVGLGPLLIDLMERGAVTALAMHGAGAVHDLELAAIGQTSEDVASAIRDGSFGMSRDTADLFAAAARAGARKGVGLARGLANVIEQRRLPHRGMSVLAAARRLRIPATVHVAVGTDIVHMHPQVPGSALGAATMEDFRLVTRVVASLERGVWLNVGSAVILPEVFLKSVAIARNLGHRLDDFLAVNLDMIQHYRPRANVTGRPAPRGINLTGHHEILLPLLRMMILRDGPAGPSAESPPAPAADARSKRSAGRRGANRSPRKKTGRRGRDAR